MEESSRHMDALPDKCDEWGLCMSMGEDFEEGSRVESPDMGSQNGNPSEHFFGGSLVRRIVN
jgi:hypothetical protein